MLTFDTPTQAPLTKTLIRRQISASVSAKPEVTATGTSTARIDGLVPNASGALQTRVSTTYLILSRLGWESSLSNSEYALAAGTVESAGSEPVLFKDPTDNEATAARLYDGHGGWTQGLYIPSFNPTSGLFVKAYGLCSELGPAYDAVYLRPIAAVTNAVVTTSLGVFNASYDPDTQRTVWVGAPPNEATLFGNFCTASTADVVLGSAVPSLAPEVRSLAHPASFEFKQAYTVEKFDEQTADRERNLLSCNNNRHVTVELLETNINNISPFMHYRRLDTLFDI